MPSPFINQGIMNRIRRMLSGENPTTIEAIMRRTGISRSGVYRYFRRLTDAGYPVSMIGISRPTKYTILRG